MSSSDEDTSVCTPPEIRKEASNVQCDQLLPQKSKEFYLKVYAQFKDWCKIKKVAKVSENVLLVYMEEKAKNKKASSLWATFSMLKQTLKLKENVDISKYYKVIAFLKRKNDSYTPKKAAVFEKHQITKFILEAPDEIFLSSKVILIIGIAGACRTDELCNMKMTDGTPYHINLPAPSSSNILCERSEEVCSEMPSTSTHAATNSEITIPVENFTSNRNTSGINMTCHNCTINYYFK
ncbi:hypothetical protein Zmor_001069 [Zophobas morio]|uniref:Uncharacterized protein n=1 Tax=Zophobas morio TaxID=2755281 RepID=A0AA38IYL5_9CUCU|nr:hypothetical protein Zmor_001069 [Zophobas morio]